MSCGEEVRAEALGEGQSLKLVTKEFSLTLREKNVIVYV